MRSMALANVLNASVELLEWFSWCTSAVSWSWKFCKHNGKCEVRLMRTKREQWGVAEAERCCLCSNAASATRAMGCGRGRTLLPLLERCFEQRLATY
jgi:hypothetical protein